MSSYQTKTTMVDISAERFVGLEWLRFALASLLVLYHTLPFYSGYTSWTVTSTIAEMGFFSTSAFFALSGFLLSHVYLRRNRLANPSDFLFKRFANLYPIHILSMLFAMALTLVTGLIDSDTTLFVGYRSNEYLERIDPELLRYVMTVPEFITNVILQLTAMQAWNPIFLAYNGPAWSISALFFFYALFPFVAPRLAKVKDQTIPLLVLMVVAPIPALFTIMTEAYANDVVMGSLQHVPLFQLPAFLGGIVAYLIYKEFRQHGYVFSRSDMWLLTSPCVVAITCAALLNWHHGIEWHLLIRNGLLLPAVLVTLMLTANLKLKDSKLARRLGAASLSIFALHIPLFVLFRRLETMLFIDFELCFTDVNACVATARDHELNVLFYPAMFVLTVAISVLFQERVVTPIRDWMLKFRK